MVPFSPFANGPSVRAVLLFLVLLLVAGPAAADPDRTAIFKLFEETAFGGADGSPSRSILIRPSGPSMRVVLYGAARAHRATVEPIAQSIAAATGLSVPVAVAEDQDRPSGRPDHIQVHVLDRPAMWRLLAGHQDWVGSRIIGSVMQGLCFYVTRGRESVRGALVVVQAGLAPEITAHCLAEEIIQTFGPLSDSQAVQPSLFNDPGPHLTAMTAADRQALALFYAPGMRPGLPRAEALAIAGRLLGVGDR